MTNGELIARVTREALESLTPREAEVIIHSFGICGVRRLADGGVAFMIGISSQERLKQIRAKALAKLRHSSRAHLLKPIEGESITMRTGLVKVLLNGRLVTGLLGNKQPGGVYSIIAFNPESIRVEALQVRGKGTVVGLGTYPDIVVGTLIPEAVVFEPGRVTTHGVFFVDWDNDGAAEQMLEWYRYQEGQRQQTIAATVVGDEQSTAGETNTGNNN